jgi:hypothetical protein
MCVCIYVYIYVCTNMYILKYVHFHQTKFLELLYQLQHIIPRLWKFWSIKNQIHLTHFVFSPATSTQISWKCKGCSHSSATLLICIIIVISASWKNHISQLHNKILMHLIIVPLMTICNGLHNYIWFLSV